MKTVSPAMAAYIGSAAMNVWGADLHTFSLSDGTIIRWSGAEAALADALGTVWQLGPPIERERLKYTRGLQVDTMKVWVSPGPEHQVGGVAVRKMLARGDFDGAGYRLDRYYGREDNRARLDVVPRFVGRVGVVRVTPTRIDLPVRSQTFLLDQNFPRNTYRASCMNVLYDATCGVSKAALQVAGTVATASSQRWLNATTSLGGHPAGWFTYGRLLFTSGANAGSELTVSADLGGGSIQFARNWPAPIASGDTFIISPGCDKSRATCSTKFGNLGRFRGLPLIPEASTTV